MKIINKGFSLIELLLVMAFIATSTAIIFQSYPSVELSFRVYLESRNVSTINAGVRSLYASQSSFKSLDNDVIIKANIPNNYSSDSMTISNKFGGLINIQAQTLRDVTSQNNAYLIEYTDVPASECVKFVMASNMIFNRIYIVPISFSMPPPGSVLSNPPGGVIVKDNNPDDGSPAIKVSPETAISSCTTFSRNDIWLLALK